MTTMIPPRPKNSFRVTLETTTSANRLDSVLMEALRNQDENLLLKTISRGNFKKLFNDKKIMIKGQNARPSSEIAKGTTYVDILGFTAKSESTEAAAE
jgi:hypothetical protein